MTTDNQSSDTSTDTEKVGISFKLTRGRDVRDVTEMKGYFIREGESEFYDGIDDFLNAFEDYLSRLEKSDPTNTRGGL